MLAEPPNASPKKSGCGSTGAILGLVLLVLFALVACAGGALALWYFDVLSAFSGGKQSSAHQHLPERCEVVMHANIQGLLETSAIRKKVVPAFDEAARNDPDSDDLATFLMTAQLNPKKDLHSLAICIQNLERNGDPDVVAIIGGSLKPGLFMKALERHGQEDEFRKPRTVDGLKIIEAKNEPMMFAQAANGAILFGNRESLLKQAADAGSAWKNYDIPLQEQLAVVLTKDAAQAMNKMAGPNNPLGNTASKVGDGEVTLSLDTGKLAFKLDVGSTGEASDAASAINELVKMLKESPGLTNDQRALAGSIEITAEGRAVVGSATIPQPMIEEMADEVARNIEKAGESL